MVKERDTQKAKVYAGERILQKQLHQMEPMTIRECQKFVDKVLARKAVIKIYGKRHITVVAGKGGGRAYREWGERSISLGRWARQPAVLLHEIAHHMAPSEVMHGPEFVDIMLRLTRMVLGKEAHEQLLASYALYGVRTRGNKSGTRKVRCPQSKKAWLEEKQAERKALKIKVAEL